MDIVVLLSEIGTRKVKNKAPASEGGRYKIKPKKKPQAIRPEL